MVQKERNTLSLNIKDQDAHRLAQAIAAETVENLTRAVTEALRERYERLHKHTSEALAADIRALAKRAFCLYQAALPRSHRIPLR